MAYVNFTNLTDWQFDASLKKIKHNTGTTRITVNALYSEVMNEFDDAGQMDDTIPMSAQTPTEYTLINGWEFSADSDLNYLYGGSITVQKATTDKDIWANFYTLGTIETGAVVYWLQGSTAIAALGGTSYTYTSGHADQLIKTTSGGSLVSSGTVTAFIRNNAVGNADLYDHFSATATNTGGRNPVPLATAADTNDDGSGGSVAGVTIAFGNVSKDIGDGNGAQTYNVVVDGGGNSVLDVYRRLKYLTRRENNTAIDSPENTTEGRFYLAAGAYTPVKTAPFGTFAGGKFFGARGVWLENVSDGNNLSLIDAAGVTRNPPTTVAITVTGLVSGDRVLVARESGGTVNKSQFTLNGVHSSATTVTVNETLTADIPDTGILRLGDTQYTYTGITRGSKQFTGVSPALSGSANAPLYQPYIDGVSSGTSMTKSFVYDADFDFIARVRKQGILPFENTGTLSSTGASISAIRTTDTIVTP
jgi:hypothetical protein